MAEFSRALHRLILIIASLQVLFASLACADYVNSQPKQERRFYAADSSAYLLLRWEPRADRPGFDATPALMAHRNGHGTYDTLWAKHLVEDFPKSAIVSANGRYAVTFDGWPAGLGFGPNVVVIYGPCGERVRSLALRDFCPFIADSDKADADSALPHDAYTITYQAPHDIGSPAGFYWGSGHYIDKAAQQLVLRVIPKGTLWKDSTDSHVEVRVDLATGTVVSPLGRNPYPDFAGPDTSWTRTFDLGSGSGDAGVASCRDGGVVVAIPYGVGFCPPVATSLRLLRIGKSGDSLWSCTLDSVPASEATVIETGDGEFVVGAIYTDCSVRPVPKDGFPTWLYLARVSAAGNVKWIGREEGAWCAERVRLACMPDGGTVSAVCWRDSVWSVSLQRRGPDGQMQWNRHIEHVAFPSGLTVTAKGDIWISVGSDGTVFPDIYTVSAAGDSLDVTKLLENDVYNVVAQNDGTYLYANGESYTTKNLTLRNASHDLLWQLPLTERKVDYAANIWPEEWNVTDIKGDSRRGWWISGMKDGVVSRDAEVAVVRVGKRGNVAWKWTCGRCWHACSAVIAPLPHGGCLVAVPTRDHHLRLYKLAAD